MPTVKRKIIQLANSTLVVSLPHAWVTSTGVKKGDEIEVDLSGPSLLMTPGNVARTPKEAFCKIDLDDAIYAQSLLGSLYRAGYDQINVRYDNPRIAKVVENAVKHLIGFEIMDQRPGFALVKSIIKETDQDVADIQGKIINIGKTMHEILLQDMKKAKMDRLEEIEQFRYTSWKFRDFGQRLILRNVPYTSKLGPQFTIIWILEKITHNYYDFYKNATAAPAKELALLLPMVEELGKYAGTIVSHLQRPELQAWEKMYAKRRGLRERIRSLEKSIRTPGLVIGLQTLVQQFHDIGSLTAMSITLEVAGGKIY